MTRQAELAWAAGLFEGEGSITTQRHNHPGTERLRVRFSMATTDRDVLERFREIVGVGTISGPTRNTMSTKDLWRWHASRPVEVQMLARYLRPWLGKRRTEALDRCLAEYDAQPPKVHWNSRKTHCKRGHLYSPENTYRTPDGRRYCRTCERLRKYAHLDVEDARADLALLELTV